MKTWLLGSSVLLGASALVVGTTMAACGGNGGTGFNPGPGGGTGPGGSNNADGGSGATGTTPILGGDGGGTVGPTGPASTSDGGIECPTGLQCDVACSGGTTTTVTGKVYDPAGKNPLYNVAVYVPATPLVALPKGVPTGSDACSCDALFKSGALTNTTTGVDGTFTLTNVPVGDAVPLVIQIGKWRRQVTIKVTACQANAQPDKSLAFLGSIPAGDTNDNIPDIAVSTGGADTLECLMLRIGLPPSEYVAGTATGGHIHVFSGGQSDLGGFGGGGGTGSGGAEDPPMPGAPASYSSLWDDYSHMMPYDIVLLSCEGGETYNSNPSALEKYLNLGGRAFGSHYHYAWFAGSLEGDNTVPAPPTDWGTNLAAWNGLNTIGNFPNLNNYAEVVQTLNGTTNPFPKGVALDQWLGDVGALGVEMAPTGQIPIFDETGNAGAANKAQAWLTDQGTTDYLSFDTPADAPAPPDGGSPAYCGRAVFAGVHVNADPNGASATDGQNGQAPPGSCTPGDLSPQEKALEFMLFDLSSCVLPDTVAPPVDAGLPPPPPK